MEQKKNNEYQRPPEIFPALETFVLLWTRVGATGQVNIITEFGGVDWFGKWSRFSLIAFSIYLQ